MHSVLSPMKRIRTFVTIGTMALITFSAASAFAADSGGEPMMSQRMTKLVLELAVIIIAARVFGFIFSRYLKQPSVLGELCAGMIIGPYALGQMDIPFIGPLFTLQHFMLPVSPELYGIATAASIVLLFLAGLETDLTTFLRYSVAGSLVGIGGVIGSFFLGAYMAVAFGVAKSFGDPAALFLGAISTATSVGITARILSDRKKLDTPEGVTILAGAVIDDVIGIVVLAVIIGITKVGGGTSAEVNWKHIGIVAAKAVGFWLTCTVLGLLLARKITNIIKWFRSPEMIASLALGLAFLLAGLSEMAGLAMIIGAYIMGLSLSRTDVVNELHEKLKGVYHFLVPIFFCVMGMLVDFKAMRGAIIFGIAYTVVAIFGKVIGCAAPALLMRFNMKGALRVGIGMLPRGEVALIIAGIGLSSGIIGSELFGVSIMMTLITTVIAPPLLISAFEGGPGISRAKEGKRPAEESGFQLDFPHRNVADFVLSRLAEAFRNEAFFVHRIDPGAPIYQMRKDKIIITLLRKGNSVFIETLPENEYIARFVVAEEILELGEAFESLKAMGGTKEISAGLISISPNG